MMIDCIDRQRFFAAHPVAARHLAEEHRWYYDHLADDAPRLATTLRRRGWYDCIGYSSADAPALEGFGALAYAASSRADYRAQFPRRTLQFLQALGSEALYLFDEFPGDWGQFAFRDFRTRNRFCQTVRHRHFSGCFKTDADGFLQLFPLFLFSRRHSQPVVYLYAEGREATVVQFLCDDGNLHTSYAAGQEPTIRHAAAAAGLHLGDPYTICGEHHIHQLPAR